MASKKDLSADEIAAILEEQVGLLEAEIYITPSDNPLLSDEDSGDEEETNFDHLSGNPLKAVSEARITKVVSGEIVTEVKYSARMIMGRPLRNPKSIDKRVLDYVRYDKIEHLISPLGKQGRCGQ